MKRLALSLLLVPMLWACGNAAGPVSNNFPSISGPNLDAPRISAGELLVAPTKLTIGGVKLSAEAEPYLNTAPNAAPLAFGSTALKAASDVNFVVPVKLRASGGAVGNFKVTGVYVITEGGVWRSGVTAQSAPASRCPSAVSANAYTLNCLQAVGWGNADVSTRDAVQVVLTLRDVAGNTYKLRDSKVVVSSGR